MIIVWSLIRLFATVWLARSLYRSSNMIVSLENHLSRTRQRSAGSQLNWQIHVYVIRRGSDTRYQCEVQEILNYIDSISYIEHGNSKFHMEYEPGFQRDARGTGVTSLVACIVSSRNIARKCRNADRQREVSFRELGITSPSSGQKLSRERIP